MMRRDVSIQHTTSNNIETRDTFIITLHCCLTCARTHLLLPLLPLFFFYLCCRCVACCQAIENYTYATEMDPKNHIFMTNRSLCYASMKKWDRSLRDADKAIALKPDWEKGWYRRGVALSNLGRYEEAMQAFQKCMDYNSTSKDYQQMFEQAKKDLYKGLTESEIFKMEGNEVRNTTQHSAQQTEASSGETL